MDSGYSEFANQVSFRLRGPDGLRGRVQRTTEFGSWENWKSISLGADAVELSDPEFTAVQRRFYRFVTP
jgi:hypothetical protein